MSREQLVRILNEPGSGPTADRDMKRVLRGIGPVELTSLPTLGDIAKKVDKLRPHWRVGDWNVGVPEEAIGRSLLDIFGLKPWTTGDDNPLQIDRSARSRPKRNPPEISGLATK